MNPILVRAFAVSLIHLTTLAAAAAAQSGSEADVRLRPGDAIRVEVKDEPTLAGEYRVDIEGFVLLPAVGRVPVADRPFSEVLPQLLGAYSTELNEPIVQLTPLIRVAVLGRVREPGLYMVDRTHSFSDVLAMAGGLDDGADPNRVWLVRDGERLATAREGEFGMVRIGLRSGDEVVVGRQPWYRENAPILIGAVTSVATAAITSLIIR